MNTYLNFSPSFLLFFARNLFFSFLPLFPFSVLVFFMFRFVLVEAGIKPCISSGELSNFISSNFQHQLQWLFYVFLNQQRNRLCEYQMKHTPVPNSPARSLLFLTAPFPHFQPLQPLVPARSRARRHLPTRARGGARAPLPQPERSNCPGAGRFGPRCPAASARPPPSRPTLVGMFVRLVLLVLLPHGPGAARPGQAALLRRCRPAPRGPQQRWRPQRPLARWRSGTGAAAGSGAAVPEPRSAPSRGPPAPARAELGPFPLVSSPLRSPGSVASPEPSRLPTESQNVQGWKKP